MPDRNYSVECNQSDLANIYPIAVQDGTGAGVWNFLPILDEEDEPTGRYNSNGWWEFQWIGDVDVNHAHAGWQTLAALEALNPGGNPAGVVVTFTDEG